MSTGRARRTVGERAADEGDRVRSRRRRSAGQGPLVMPAAAGNRAVGRALQARLSVGPAGDRYEREADQVAHDVMASLDASARRQEALEEDELMARHADGIQREDLDEDELMAKHVEGIQREDLDEDELMTKPAVVGLEGGPLDASVGQRIDAMKAGGGRPLDAPVQAKMESEFGADFSAVRVHSGSEADALNDSIQAKAFTTGSDVFFREGDYSPDSPAGQELIAHELTHVVQQGHAPALQTERDE